MSKDFYTMSDEVETEEDFIKFIEALAFDKLDQNEKEEKEASSPYGAGHNGWENNSIDTFLKAASAWGSSTVEGTEYYKKPVNPWKRAAQIMHAGKFYE